MFFSRHVSYGRSAPRNAGFTLIELTIVILVIGLLVGGTLRGHSVVDNARIKRMALDTATFGNAIQVYRQLYHALPGDDPRAADRWPHAGQGNGDGVVDGHWIPRHADEETSLLWSHLRYAQLLPGAESDTTLPRHPLGGRGGVGDHLLKMPGLTFCMEDIPARYAVGYDIQFDDGQWVSGRIRGTSLKALLDETETFEAQESAVLLCTQLAT